MPFYPAIVASIQYLPEGIYRARHAAHYGPASQHGIIKRAMIEPELGGRGHAFSFRALICAIA
jgi:hypothetical protein